MIRLGRRLSVIALLAVAAGAAEPTRSAGQAETITVRGPAQVIDGDTLEVEDWAIRLVGIDAPEIDQTCQNRSGGEWRCGITAKAHLVALIEDREVRCEGDRLYRWRRLLAVCHLDGISVANLNALMVLDGMAVPYKGAPQYRVAEAFARSRREGLWSGSFVLPWDWWAGKRERHIMWDNEHEL